MEKEKEEKEKEEKLLDAATAALEDSTRFRKSFGEVSVVRGTGGLCDVWFASLFKVGSYALVSTALCLANLAPALRVLLLCLPVARIHILTPSPASGISAPFLQSSFFSFSQGFTEMEI